MNINPYGFDLQTGVPPHILRQVHWMSSCVWGEVEANGTLVRLITENGQLVTVLNQQSLVLGYAILSEQDEKSWICLEDIVTLHTVLGAEFHRKELQHPLMDDYLALLSAATISGSDLMERVVTTARLTAHKNGVLYLEVQDDNEQAIALYKRFGFNRFNTYHNYYGPNTKALAYKLHL